MSTVSLEVEEQAILRYILYIRKISNHTDYLYEDGRPYKNLVINAEPTGLTATLDVKYTVEVNGKAVKFEQQEHLYKSNGQWVSDVMYSPHIWGGFTKNEKGRNN